MTPSTLFLWSLAVSGSISVLALTAALVSTLVSGGPPDDAMDLADEEEE